MDADDKERKDAWNEYLAQTKNLSGDKYEEVEPWAWKRLMARRKKLRRVKSVA